MKLYRIRKTGTQEYFVCFQEWRLRLHGDFPGYFNESGSFWKRPDTAHVNLKRLCSDAFISTDWFHPLSFENFDREKLPQYEIVVSDVTVNGEEVIPAADFIKEENT